MPSEKSSNEKWAVEARIFNNGRIVTKVRLAQEGEEEGCKELEKCDIWIDLFDNKVDAQRFAADYKNA